MRQATAKYFKCALSQVPTLSRVTFYVLAAEDAARRGAVEAEHVSVAKWFENQESGLNCIFGL